VVHGRDKEGKLVTIFLDDDVAALVRPKKLSDQPETLSKSCYGI